MRLVAWPVLALLVTHGFVVQDSSQEPIYTAADLYGRCAGSRQDRQLCFAYVRGFSDGNRWLLYDAPIIVGRGADAQIVSGANAPQAVCIPSGEPIQSAADLFVARFQGREGELEQLSPFRALSLALSSRYPCRNFP